MRGIKPDFRTVGLLLLPLLLSSCAHKNNQAQNPPLAPPIEDVPPQKPSTAPTNLPPPVVTVPEPAKPTQPAPSTPTAQEQPPPPKPTHKHHKTAPAKPAPSTSERAANNAPPEVSAIGQLSSGDPSDVRTETANSIADTERKLKQVNRKLSAQEQKTAAQIREFLKQARAALSTGDTDGAYTLALKAKVLLGEIIQ